MKMNALRRFWMLLTNPPSAKSIAAKELESAKRSYLENKTHAEYYATLCSFENQRIARLEKYLEEPLLESQP
jgi:hypothetical protein